MANNFDGVNGIDLPLIPIVTFTADRHLEKASMILMELASTLEWRNKCLKIFNNLSEGNNRHEPALKKIWLKKTMTRSSKESLCLEICKHLILSE
jgi:hypothetical protein